MDIIAQLQEHVNLMAEITFNVYGTLQRDAPLGQISPNYPEPPATATTNDELKLLSAVFVTATKRFDALVEELTFSKGEEEAQLKRISELKAESHEIGRELQKQLEAAEKEHMQVQELYVQVADNGLNMKKP